MGTGGAEILSVAHGFTVYDYVDAFVFSCKIKNERNPAGIAHSAYDGYKYAIYSI